MRQAGLPACGRSPAPPYPGRPNDVAAHGARPSERRYSVSPSAPSNGALQLGQIVREAAQHFEHRFLVVQEHVAPHDGIGRGDAREVAEAAGRELDHLAVGDALEVGCGVDDVVGDEVRQVAGDGQHEIMVLGRHDLDLGAERLPERLELLDRLRIGAFLGCQHAPAAVEQLGKAGFRSRLLGAGDGMARRRSARPRAHAGPRRARWRPSPSRHRSGWRRASDAGDLLGNRPAGRQARRE